MKYTNAQRKQIRKDFIAAKKLLWNGRSSAISKYRYICHAIETATDYNNRLSHEVIRERLFPYKAAETWLHHKDVPWNSTEDLVKMQAWRHQWLDMLIKEFSV